jgi:glycosyltransferase involved in cell wall biosynthesis
VQPASRKLLVISGAFPPGNSGEAHHALLLARNLAQRGFDVDVLTGIGAVSEPSVRVWPLMRDWSWQDLPRLVRFLRSSRPDIVLLMYIGWIYNDHPMITYTPTITRLLLPRTRFVTQFENVIGSLPGRKGVLGQIFAVAAVAAAGVWKVQYRFGTLIRDSDRLISLSEHHRRLLSGRWRSSEQSIALIPPPPLTIFSRNDEETRQRGRALLGVDHEHFLIVYLGYVYPGRGLETLLSGFALLLEERPHARLAVVGAPLERFEDYARELRHLPARLGIEGRVRWSGGFAWDSTVGSTMLRAADVCVMPIDVGVALNNSSVGAAASHGLPLVATRGERVESAFHDGKNILFCRPRDPASMAKAIRMVMDDASLRERLSRGAEALAQQWFSWERAVKQTIATFGD